MNAPNLVFSFFVLISLLLLFFGFKRNIIISLLLINLAADLTAGYSIGDQVHTGLIRGVIVTVIISIGLIKYVKLNKITIVISIFLFYLFIMIVLFSSDRPYSFLQYLKWYTSLLLLPLSYYTVSFESLKRICYFSLVALIFILVNFFLAQIFKLGPTHYESDIHTGGTDVQISFTIALILLISPLTIKFFKYNSQIYLFFLLFCISFIAMILLGRRGAILAYGVGVSIYFLISNEKFQMFSLILFFIVISLVSLPLYENQLNKIISHRTRDVENMENYGRLNEFKLYPERVLNSGRIQDVLIGQEMFNYHTVIKSTRGIHTIYTTILYGSGLIGLVLYLSIGVILIKKFFHTTPSNSSLVIIKILGICLIVANLIIDFSGSGLLYRSFYYSFLGIFLRLIMTNFIPVSNLQYVDTKSFINR